MPTRRAPTKRGRTYRLFRQLHLWIGAWGAIAAILFGATGFVQNHRATLKLPQGESTELSKVELEVPEPARGTPEALRDWLRDDQHIPVDSFRAQPGGPAEMGGQRMKQAGALDVQRRQCAHQHGRPNTCPATRRCRCATPSRVSSPR